MVIVTKICDDFINISLLWQYISFSILEFVLRLICHPCRDINCPWPLSTYASVLPAPTSLRRAVGQIYCVRWPVINVPSRCFVADLPKQSEPFLAHIRDVQLHNRSFIWTMSCSLGAYTPVSNEHQ